MKLTRYLLAIVAAIALAAVPSWSFAAAAESATPTAKASDYPAEKPAADAPLPPAVLAALAEAAALKAKADEPWYKGAAGVAASIALTIALAMLGVARHSASVVPQPWGTLLSLLANGAYGLLAPKVEQLRDKQLEHHEDTTYTTVEVLEQLGDSATVADVKAKLLAKLPSGARDVLNQVVAEVKADLAAKTMPTTATR